MTTATIPILGTADVAGASVTTVTVGHENLAPNGPWASPAGSDTGTAGFTANAPGTPPVGTGSLTLDVPAGQHRSVYDYQFGVCANWPVGFPNCTTPVSGWLKLSDITALGYSTYRISGPDSAANALPSLNIEVDPTGTGAGYTTLVWERANNGGTTTDDTWETWDAYNGGSGNWWSTASIPGAPATVPVPWSTILANNPNAKVKYGLGPNVGTGPKFKGAVDGLTVGVSGNDTVFDFEATSTSKVIGADDTSVLPTPTTEWISNNDLNNGAGDVSYVTGPATPPAGVGSARIATATSPDMSVLAYANIGNSATRFSQITDLRYSTYRSSADAGDLLAIALQLNVDYDNTDSTTSWQGRLVYEPYQTIGSGNVPQNTWQTWNTLSGKWWMSGTPKVGNVTVPAACPMGSPCTWAALLTAYPKAGFNGGQPGALFKAGSTWPGFVGNVDDFHIGIDDSDSAFDFEPVCSTDCYVATTGSDTGTGTVADPFLTIQKGVDTVNVGGTVHVANGTYAAGATINKALTLDGQSRAGTIINGSNTGTGLDVGATTGVTITHLTVQHFDMGVRTTTGPINGFTLAHADIVDNVTHGIWSQAFGVNNYTVDDVNASRNNQAGGLAGRGIWMINGAKSGVTITNSTFDQNGLVGVDISDGTVTGATITNNVVTNNGDSGIGVLGAIGGSATLVANNTVTNNGRYGIEIKQSTGDGTDSGANSVTVKNNTISRTVAATDARDYAGIALIRRSPASPSPSAVSGIVVEGNSVSGYHRKPVGSTGDGFGVAAGGSGHVITQNTLTNNDVGVQVQAGNPTINQQSTAYFDRDDSPLGGAAVQRNAITGNGLGVRTVGSVTGTVTCNWYGSSSGPGAPNGPGSGDGISTGLVFTPWLLTSNLNGACATPSVSVGSLSNSEGSGVDTVVNVPVTLSNAVGATVTVNYATVDGSGAAGAVAPNDYTSTSGSVTFLPGETNKTVPVTIRGAAGPVQFDEKNETFTVVLSSPVNATVGTGSGTVTILNDDTPTISIPSSQVNLVEGNSGTQSVSVPVTLTNPSAFPITVNYSTANGSAVTTSDYLPATGTLTIPVGQTTASFAVSVKGDNTLEDYEFFTVSISTPGGGGSAVPILGNATRTIQILNDEKPSLTGTAPSGKEGSVLQFGATLVQRYYLPVTVNYTTGNLTAVQPGDYTSAAGSLLFPAGTNGTQTVGVQTKYDFTTEVAETFNMTWTSTSIKVSPLVKKGTIKANNS